MDIKRGISQKEANKRLLKYGYNEIKDTEKISPVKILLRQIRKNFVLYLFSVAVILSFLVGKTITGYTLLGIIVLIIGIGFVQEYRAEKAIISLKKMIVPFSIVIRDGKQIEIPSINLVPGDIIILRTGEKVPADCIIKESKDIRVNESVLSGESSEIAKSATSGKITDKNMLFMGTFIVNGKAIAEIIATGMSTRFGKIASMISKEEKQLPLQDKVNSLSKFMVCVALTGAIILGSIMLVQAKVINQEILLDIVFVMIALAVASFPESFPVVLITTLSVGTHRMARRNAIVNRMSVIETLGETTVICSDKTGTITKGEMTVKKIYTDGKVFEVTGTGYNGNGEFILDNTKQDVKKHPILSFLCVGAVLCNDANISRTGDDMEFNVIGTPTEIALLVMCAKSGIYKEDLDFTRKDEIPFSSERKLMSVLVSNKKKNYIFTKGAPEYLLQRCSHIQKSNGVFKLTERERKYITELFYDLNSKAYRTLAIAYKEDKKLDKEKGEKNLIFLGLVSMEDPPREEVINAIKICKLAGISVKMVTGDNKETALSIAKQIGINGKVMTGNDIDNLSDDELVVRVKDAAIFSRVRPEHKLRIVNALKTNGEVVTMTGDGVNDAPALKAAHIGIAMGKSGTDVSRSVADITLKDDNFSTIVSAVQEGRTIFNNMRKFTTYQLSCNFAELMIIILGVAMGLPLPLLAIHIIFMNMVTSDFPAITLGLNKSSDDVMERKPRKNSKIITKKHFIILAIAGTIMGAGTLGVFIYNLYVLKEPIEVARTSALLTLIFFEIANAYNFRSFRKRTLTRSPFVNKYLTWASIISIAATIAIIYTPLNQFFDTVPLNINLFLLTLIPAFSILIIFDYIKYLNEKRGFWRDLN